jgi:hypothetical protein
LPRLITLAVVRFRGRVRLVVVVVVTAEAGRRRGLGIPDGRVAELARAGLGALERTVAILVLVRRLVLQVGRRRRRGAEEE